MVKATKKSKPRPRKGYLPIKDIGPVCIPELDDAAKIYKDAIDARLPYTKDEKEKKQSLTELMIKHGKMVYVSSDGIEVDATNKTNVTLKKVEKPTEANGDGDSELES